MTIVDAWYRKHTWLWLLWPLSALFTMLARQRRARLQRAWPLVPAAIPVVVVGNITVGGTGKSPFVIALVRKLQAIGLRPAVITRGFGGRAPHYPCFLDAASTVEEAGDEAIMIRRSVSCPVVVDRRRVRAIEALRKSQTCDVIISDDGLQHYAMPRALEIVMLDGERLLGNGLCLPAGPLREPATRLEEVDYVVVNGDSTATTLASGRYGRKPAMHLRPTAWVNLRSGARVDLHSLPLAGSGRLHAFAGIGNPQRFFATVRALGYSPLCHPFPDHYRFGSQDLRFASGNTVVMTQKDAVKCESFAGADYWYLAVEAELDSEFSAHLLQDISARIAAATQSD